MYWGENQLLLLCFCDFMKSIRIKFQQISKGKKLAWFGHAASPSKTDIHCTIKSRRRRRRKTDQQRKTSNDYITDWMKGSVDVLIRAADNQELWRRSTKIAVLRPPNDPCQGKSVWMWASILGEGIRNVLSHARDPSSLVSTSFVFCVSHNRERLSILQQPSAHRVQSIFFFSPSIAVIYCLELDE